MTEQKVINILIADDHQILIDGIKSLLRKEKNIQVVAEANSAEIALEIIKNRDDIDILITDINMSGMSGIELTKIIKHEFPKIKVLVLSMFNEPEIVNEILNADAEGYILKNTGKQELIEAISKIADCGTYYCNEVISRLLKENRNKSAVSEKIKALSNRELEIIKLIVKEFTTAQIAEKLFISPRTVDTHRKNIIQKVNSKSLVGLIKFALDNKLDE
jgi:DNA-binding NarL/FixJ family response regulator